MSVPEVDLNTRLSRAAAQEGLLAAAFAVIPSGPRRKLLLLVGVQVFIGLLDLVAVALVGVLGSLAIVTMESQHPAGILARLLEILHMSRSSAQMQTAVIAVLTTALFLVRTVAAIYLTRRALHFLAHQAAQVSAELISRLLGQPLAFVQSRTTQDLIYSVTASVNSLVLGVLGAIVMMAGDASVLVALSALMLFASPLAALLAGATLFALMAALHRFTTARAQTLGSASASLDIASRDALFEAITTFRELRIRGTQWQYSEALRELRRESAAVNAEFTFLPTVGKYVLESAVVVGALLVGAVQFAVSDARQAVGVLAVFLAAGTRLAPAAMRLQQTYISLKVNAGQADAARTLAHAMMKIPETAMHVPFTRTHPGFAPDVDAVHVSFSYPGAESFAICDLDFNAHAGQLVAIVGPSGAGKSTIADLLLGVLEPESGAVHVSGVTAAVALRRWPGAIAYVPQETHIVSGSIAKNVALGYALEEVPVEAVWSALRLAQLDDFVESLEGGLEAEVGERGTRLSGGQRQRLGIARALLTSPQVVILDEATSALDAETEHRVSTAVAQMRGRTTLIVIAHRLAIVRDADLVIYVAEGRVQARGTFDEVRRSVPDFDRQAELLGL